MIKQYPSSGKTVLAVNCLLADLNSSLSEHNKKLSDFDLPQLPSDYKHPSGLSTEIVEELSVHIPPEDIDSFKCLNPDQLNAYHMILQASTDGKQNFFFIDGPGGTGKTFLYRCILAHFRKRGLIAIATSTPGLAATMMPGGRTAHSRFKIPVPCTATSTCRIRKHSGLAELFRQASIIIWDEATMTHRHAFKAVDKTLQDITGSNEIFGGKLFVLGGDFRQVLPVVSHGSRTDIIRASIQNSYIWQHIKIIRLHQNMRAVNDPAFYDFLLRVGDGIEKESEGVMVWLPNEITLEWRGDDSVENLISIIFPNISDNARNKNYMIDRAIITTTNDHADELNNKMIDRLPGKEQIYYSHDFVENDCKNLYQLELLNTINQSGLPPHKLRLKIGCSIILTRNLDPKSDLCNGTRLICRNFYPHLIDAEIVTGSCKGKTVFIPRIPLKSSENMKRPMPFTRKQFPVRLSFALTIHMEQGQTIPYVGIYIPHDVFTHRQLYVALSRGKSSQTTKILVKQDYNDKKLQLRKPQ